MTNEQRNRNQVNTKLAEWTKNRYFDGLPVQALCDLLEEYGFDTENLMGVYCGREGRVHEQVGPKTWFMMTWFKMDSGRFEVVAYLS